MKTLTTSYTFDASEKKVTFTGYVTISLEKILLITNVTDQVIIYNFADSNKGGTVATNVLTLEYDTSLMDDTDKLQIFYQDESLNQTVEPVFGQGTIDSFGHLITGTVNNQIDIQYYRDTPANLVTVTSGSGGGATATNGMATYAATTTTSSYAKGVTTQTTVYTAGAEVYCIFTAGWTGLGGGTSFQRIGLYGDTDGFFIGYEADVFNATIRKGGADTSVAKSAFSLDKLTGAADSKFTRNGVPEAIDLTKLNVFRIRFGWVGSAPINYEVLAPDGNWVTFHKIKQPNNAALPSINSADLPITCHVSSGNSGQALTIITNCWAAGTTQALGKLNATLASSNYAALSRSVITGETTAGGGGFVNVKVNPSGTLETNATIASLPNEGQQTMANSISVAVASNQSAIPVTQSGTWDEVGINDSGNSITIDGTVTADLSATDNAVLDAIEADTTTLAGAVAGTEMQVDVLTMPTTTVQATNLDVRDLTSTDVVTVTGGVGQTADVKVTLDSESVAVTGTFYQATQPVSGTVTANAGTNLNTSALALETGGNLAAIGFNANLVQSNNANFSNFDYVYTWIAIGTLT